MGMMAQAMRHELTIPCVVDWQVFKHWDRFLNWIYKGKMSSVKKWQIFHSSTVLGLTRMSFKSSNVEGAKTNEEFLVKRGVTAEERSIILLEQPPPLYANKPGLREIKQVELWSKYRPLVPKEFRDECCPMPAKEVIDREKNKKKEKGKLKRDEKKEKGKLKVAPQTTIGGVATDKTVNDPPELTAHAGTSSNPRAPLSPSKRSLEEAGLG
jgi:hypothetical protein